MGGLLMNLGRVDKAKYLEIIAEITPYLDQKLGKYYKIPRYYASKPTFGDVDILVSTEIITEVVTEVVTEIITEIVAENKFGSWQNLTKSIASDLKIIKFKSSGHIFSTAYLNFQVDFFCVKTEFFESTYNFLCFNDLGNLLGKMFHRFNLKFGENGLSYVYRRADGHYKTDLPVCLDIKKIIAFLDLDFSYWQNGFETLEQMFEWVVTSPYFSYKPYFDTSKTTEKRIEQRTTVSKFTDWLQENNVQKHYFSKENREEYLPIIADYFAEANLYQLIENEKDNEIKAIKIAEKFNGKIIMTLTNLEGKELGDFITRFKAHFATDKADFEDFILQNSAENIKNEILKFK